MSIVKRKRKPITGDTFFDACILFILFVVCAITLYPVIYTLSVSISSIAAVERKEVWLWPVGFNIASYKLIAKHPNILTSYANTLLYASVGPAYSMVLTVCAAYALSRRWMYGRDVFMLLFAFTMWFGGGLVPYYLLLRDLGLYDKRLAMIIPSAVSVWNIIVMRTAMQQIPDSIEESAKLDGANDIVVMVRIMLPMSVPVLATITLFYIVGKYNEWFMPMILLPQKSMHPMPNVIRELLISYSDQTLNRDFFMGDELTPNPVSFRSAVVFITMIPLMVLYPFIQRYFIKGIMIGAIKG